MSFVHKPVRIIFLSALVIMLNACATVETVSSPKADVARVFSGTRLNYHALHNDRVAMMNFDATPPRYPLLDLPGSLLLDTLNFPLTSSYSLYYTLIE